MIYLYHRPRVPERVRLPPASQRLLWMAALLVGIEITATSLAMHVPARFREVRIIAGVVALQWVIPAAVLVAASLARTHYADVVLKRSATLVVSVVVGTVIAWWIPGLQRGIPTVLGGLLGAGLLLAAPLLHRLTS